VPKPFRHVLTRRVETPAASVLFGVDARRRAAETGARHQVFALLSGRIEALFRHPGHGIKGTALGIDPKPFEIMNMVEACERL
jgi:hypothetical protein